MNVQFPSVLRPLFGKLTWRKDPSSKVIYLTFDDGPVPEVTPKVLNILDEYNVKATFFCVGENVHKHPDVFAEVLKRGHQTGNHTYNHLKGLSTSTEDYIANTEKAQALVNSRLFRPPHGHIKRRQLNRLKSQYEVIMWDVITHDYSRTLPPEKVLENVVKYSRNGSIIVFHDSVKAQKNVLEVLPQAIEHLQAKGYEFGTL